METGLFLRCPDGRHRVYRRRGKRSANACVIERDVFSGGSVMVWVGGAGRGGGDISRGLATFVVDARNLQPSDIRMKFSVRLRFLYSATT